VVPNPSHGGGGQAMTAIPDLTKQTCLRKSGPATATDRFKVLRGLARGEESVPA